MSPCFGSCPSDVEFKKITFEGKDFLLHFSYSIVQETLKYGNQKKHDLSKEDVSELLN